MKKLLVLLLVAFVLFSVTGCLKVRKVIQERTDQTVRGNQGVIYGETPPDIVPTEPKLREFYEVDVQLPPFGLKQSEYEEYEKRSDAVVMRDKQGKDVIETETTKEDIVTYTPESAYEPVYEEEAVYQEVKITPAEPVYTEYKVKSGQSLWSIAKEVYGDPNRWRDIFEANRDRINNPGQIKPGMILRIPE